MRYQKFTPAESLRPFVECYYVWEGATADRLEVQTPPSVFCAMVFNFSDPYEASQNGGAWSPVPAAFVSGQFTSNYRLALKGTIGMAGIVFKACTLHNFFGIRMSQLVNNRMALPLLLGDDAQPLYDAAGRATADADRIAVLENFLIARLPQLKKRLSIIDEAVDMMDAGKGCQSVDAVAKELKISRRYLEKKFLEKVGVSPKFYSRIKRFSVLSNIIAHSDTIDWQQIVFEYGFHDQSHLVKEFMEFNQMNPSAYHSRHQEMTRYLKNRD